MAASAPPIKNSNTQSCAGITDTYFLEARLWEAGYLTTRLTNAGKLQQWDSIPDGVRAVIVPDRTSLSPRDADRVRHFIEQGGTALARGLSTVTTGGFGNAALSTVEGVAATVTAVLAVVVPLLATLLVVGLLAFAFRLWTRRRRRASG